MEQHGGKLHKYQPFKVEHIESNGGKRHININLSKWNQ